MGGGQGRKLGIVNSDGHIWSEQRRFALKHLRDLGFGKKSLDSAMIQEADQVIDMLLESVDGIVEMKNTFNTAIINVLWQIVASKKFDPNHPDTNQIMEMSIAQVSNFSLVNLYPSLSKLLPLRNEDQLLLQMKTMMKTLIYEHLQDIDYDHPRDFIDVYLMQMKSNSNFDEEQLTVICMEFFNAGADTTSSTLLWAVLFMALHSKVQDTCQAEIYEQIGSRPPSMDDAQNLPYVMATLMEIQRMAMVAPGSLPHILMNDTLINNYTFKKGTIFLANLSKYLMDPIIFPLPKYFNPNRFLDDNGKIKKFEYFTPFSIGKRICMGESLAKNELFLFFVRILQRVSFQQNYRLSPDDVFIGLTRVPKPYKVKILMR